MSVWSTLRRLMRGSKVEAKPATPHPTDCPGCAHLDRMIGARYKPPEVLLATGVPLACVSLALNIEPKTLRAIAKDAGLVEVKS